MGLPRSGTTYLMTLLNSHRDVLCSGELFNPHAIVGVDDRQEDWLDVLGRDRAPLWFMDRFFSQANETGVPCAGFKYMLGHNVRLLRALSSRPDLTLVYVWRENRLAQVSSLIKATRSRKWAQSRVDSHIGQKIDATPQQISQRWHEYAWLDHLFADWLDRQPHRSVTLEYRELFQPGFEGRICDFLGLRLDRAMKSPLVKQGANSILDRFDNPGPIQHYFRQIAVPSAATEA